MVEPRINPLENTQIEFTPTSGIDYIPKTLLKCLFTSKLFPTGPTINNYPRSVPIKIFVLSNHAWAVKFLVFGNFLTYSYDLKE